MIGHLIEHIKQDIIDINLSIYSNENGMPTEFWEFKKLSGLTIIDSEYIIFQTNNNSINKKNVRIIKNDVTLLDAYDIVIIRGRNYLST